MSPVEMVRLSALMVRTRGRAEIGIGLIDGPVLLSHPDFTGQSIHEIPGRQSGACNRSDSIACLHGTFVAGILCARRGSAAPAICPGCTLFVRPIFPETDPDHSGLPSASPEELAAAIVDCVQAGARILNLSTVLALRTPRGDHELGQALNYAGSRGVIAVAAAGNAGTVGSSVITGHAGVIPVTACDRAGRLLSGSNLGKSIGNRGLMAPGDGVTSLGANGTPQVFTGTSVAAPFVTGTIALLWSELPAADAVSIRSAVVRSASRRRAITPPLLDAWAAYEAVSVPRMMEMAP